MQYQTFGIPCSRTYATDERTSKKYVRAFAFAIVAGVTIATAARAVVREQETVGASVDDAAITSSLKARLVQDKTVDVGAIGVETLKGTVSLSGFATSSAEQAQAEYIARGTNGMGQVLNNVSVRP
jgi:osmotically-inducible protein OsmY